MQWIITINICTYHNNWAVVACEQLNGSVDINLIIIICYFHKHLFVDEKVLVE